jgi:hypothetical protein
MLRTRAPRWLYIDTTSPPSHRNPTGRGRGAPAGVTVVSHTTISSRRRRATLAPNSVPSSITSVTLSTVDDAAPGAEDAEPRLPRPCFAAVAGAADCLLAVRYAASCKHTLLPLTRAKQPPASTPVSLLESCRVAGYAECAVFFPA